MYIKNGDLFMTFEDAKYYSLLMLIGEYKEFDKFTSNIINSDEDLGDVEADLLFASNNKSACFNILHNYYMGKVVDDAEVAFRIIKFIKNKLSVGEIDRTKAIDYFRAISNSEFSSTEEKKEPWITMSLLRYAKDDGESIIYNEDFDNFINNGVILTDDKDFQEKFKKHFENE